MPALRPQKRVVQSNYGSRRKKPASKKKMENSGSSGGTTMHEPTVKKKLRQSSSAKVFGVESESKDISKKTLEYLKRRKIQTIVKTNIESAGNLKRKIPSVEIKEQLYNPE